MTDPCSIFGKPVGPTSDMHRLYEIEGEERLCGEYQISRRLCQGGARETFQGTSPQPIHYQQDRAVAGTSETQLTEHELRSACAQAACLAAECIDGSTVSIVALNATGDLYVANIADSPVMAFVVTKSGQVTGHYLIGDPHNAVTKIPIDPHRLPPEAGDYATLRRRFYDISISRAVGDRLYPLSSEADIRSYDSERFFAQAGADGHVFLCVASDGICPPMKDGKRTVDDGLWVTYYAERIASRLQRPGVSASSERLADWIMEEAVARWEGLPEPDNILLQVVEITPLRRETLFMAVCDGHRAANLEATDFTGHCAQQTAEHLCKFLIQSAKQV